MRKFLPRCVSSIFLAATVLAAATRLASGASVGLTWNPSPDGAGISGYKIYYSPAPLTGVVPGGPLTPLTGTQTVGNQTSATLSGLAIGNLYVAVSALSSDGSESDFSNVLTLNVPAVGSVVVLPDDGGSPTNNPSPNPTQPNPTAPSPNPSNPSNPLPTQMNLVGMLPRLAVTNIAGAPVLTVAGVLGATFTIQVATNINGFQSWTTVTNLPITTLDPDSPPAGGNALARAFEPGMETFQDPSTNMAGFRVYRIYMPMGFAVVADQVLKPKGYNTRLVVIRLPGLDNYIVCYVTEEGIYLDYNDETFLVKTEASGPTIREIATKVASVLTQNWTSASEFTVTEGLKQILATVVQTDPPSADPALGAPGGVSIAIDF